MENKLGADIQYIGINFILLCIISLATRTNSNLFPEKYVSE